MSEDLPAHPNVGDDADDCLPSEAQDLEQPLNLIRKVRSEWAQMS